MGDSSATPRKIFLYNDSEPSNCVLAATPTRKYYEQPLKSSLHHGGLMDAAYESENSEYEEGESPSNTFYRPKTSRGTSRPSPDAFFDYVIPSPVNQNGRDRLFEKSRSASTKKKSSTHEGLILTKESYSRALSKTESSDKMDGESADAREMTGTTQYSAIFTGCWLFGSLLRV